MGRNNMGEAKVDGRRRGVKTSRRRMRVHVENLVETT